jgi:hypothetical protein
MAENAPPAASSTTGYNYSRGRSIGKNDKGVVKISGICGSQCSYTIGTTSSFTIGASSSVTVGAALSATIGGQLSFTSAVAFTYVASRTMTITRGIAMTMVYADSYAYQKGAKYAVEAHSNSTFTPNKRNFITEMTEEVARVKSTISKSETKSVAEEYTVNTQNYVLNVDKDEAKSVLGKSLEAIQDTKSITSKDLYLAGNNSVSIGTGGSSFTISKTAITQVGNISLGAPSASSLSTLLAVAETQLDDAKVALETAGIRAAAAQAVAAQIQVVANTAAVNPVPQVAVSP